MGISLKLQKNLFSHLPLVVVYCIMTEVEQTIQTKRQIHVCPGNMLTDLKTAPENRPAVKIMNLVCQTALLPTWHYCQQRWWAGRCSYGNDIELVSGIVKITLFGNSRTDYRLLIQSYPHPSSYFQYWRR